MKERLTFKQVAALLAPARGGKHPHKATLYRWSECGIKSKSGRIVRLATRKIGGTITTTIDDIEEFLDAVNDTTPKELPDSAAVAKRKTSNAHKATMDYLRAEGVIK
jgi:Protein of unknown function (DUF1580)